MLKQTLVLVLQKEEQAVRLVCLNYEQSFCWSLEPNKAKCYGLLWSWFGIGANYQRRKVE
jgi:hypothetical protein